MGEGGGGGGDAAGDAAIDATVGVEDEEASGINTDAAETRPALLEVAREGVGGGGGVADGAAIDVNGADLEAANVAAARSRYAVRDGAEFTTSSSSSIASVGNNARARRMASSHSSKHSSPLVGLTRCRNASRTIMRANPLNS